MVNVSMESVIAQKVEKEEAIKKSQEKKVKFGNVEFDEKHYLNTRLTKSEDKKEIVIRLLPFSENELSPFKKIYVHSVKINNERGEKQWKKFICPVKMGKGDKCPFCEIAAQARKMKFDTTDEALKKEYGDVEFMNSVKEYWLVRCIDRDHEEDGVKFWRFPDAKNGEGIWDKIYALFETKKKRGVSIFDLYNGKDLIITISKQVNGKKEKLVYQIQDDENIRPLSESEEQMEAWVNDKMSWEDVYSIKDYDFLSIIAAGDYPVWDKSQNKWVPKSDTDGLEENFQTTTEDDSVTDEDLAKFKVEVTPKNTDSDEGKNVELSDEEDDLPF